jgi:glutamyl/glutaminyl-tRNA synthetase
MFGHLPLLLNPDGSKMSKRKGDVSVQDHIVSNSSARLQRLKKAAVGSSMGARRPRFVVGYGWT